MKRENIKMTGEAKKKRSVFTIIKNYYCGKADILHKNQQI